MYHFRTIRRCLQLLRVEILLKAECIAICRKGQYVEPFSRTSCCTVEKDNLRDDLASLHQFACLDGPFASSSVHGSCVSFSFDDGQMVPKVWRKAFTKCNTAILEPMMANANSSLLNRWRSSISGLAYHTRIVHWVVAPLGAVIGNCRKAASRNGMSDYYPKSRQNTIGTLFGLLQIVFF